MILCHINTNEKNAKIDRAIYGVIHGVFCEFAVWSNFHLSYCNSVYCIIPCYNITCYMVPIASVPLSLHNMGGFLWKNRSIRITCNSSTNIESMGRQHVLSFYKQIFRFTAFSRGTSKSTLIWSLEAIGCHGHVRGPHGYTCSWPRSNGTARLHLAEGFL